MGGKRKRNRPAGRAPDDNKRQRLSASLNSKTAVVKQALLAQYYPKVVSLREYLLLKLPTSSKVRRKKILSLGHKSHVEETEQENQSLAEFLDNVLVGISPCAEPLKKVRLKQWNSFSQRGDVSVSTLANVSGAGVFSQSEIVDFAISSLVSKSNGSGRAQHLLCQGFRRDVSSRSVYRDENLTSAIPNVVSTYPNSHVTSMKTWPWPRVLTLLGKAGESLMLDLILDCGIFVPIESGHGSYHQLSGHPLSELSILQSTNVKSDRRPGTKGLEKKETHIDKHSLASINFVRSRMLYARPALNAKGSVQFGLRHIHVLNRFPYKVTSHHEGPLEVERQQSTKHVMMYIFPRQFGLHNAFTSDVNTRETVQPFKDYTLREDEINTKYPLSETIKIPKRLRGEATDLVKKLQIQQTRCSYSKLLEHYCPLVKKSLTIGLDHQNFTASTAFKTQDSTKTESSPSLTSLDTASIPPKVTMMDHATPVAKVSAFCRAVLRKLIPHEFWGVGDVQLHNENLFHQNNLQLIATQIADIDWLSLPRSDNAKLSQSDFNKRREIFLEFLYYLFDSILIPLIRTHFHVTESNIHRNRLFFFRHDVWKSLVEPALASLKTKMFEEVKLGQAQRILGSRTLGFSQMRLLPKEYGVRPIMNLKRRAMQKGNRNMLGSSINSVLAPVYNVFTLEKTVNPDRLGSTLFSVGDMYKKLKSFKASIRDASKPFYFAKVDVQGAFDTIPQAAVVRLMSSLPSESQYHISKYAEIKPGVGYREDSNSAKSKPSRRWKAIARPIHHQNFDEDLESDLAVGRKNTIFVENIVNQMRDTDELMALLSEHIQLNMVKIGKKFYRQKEGIPQGSVVSSLLCNYFYADLEAQHLSFLSSEDSLLLRLIDDFLLITTNRSHAKSFLQVMHDGLPEYGVTVNPDKTLANFEATINKKKVPRVVGTRAFPYCGSFIDIKTLNISRDRERRKDMAIADTLTVAFSRSPGKMFHRHVLNSFKLQSHPMYHDTNHNSLPTVLSNLSSAFSETALKAWTYFRSLPINKQPPPRLIMKTISDLIEMAFVLMKSKARRERFVGEGAYGNMVKKGQAEILALKAFKEVLGKRQSRFREVLGWIEGRLRAVER